MQQSIQGILGTAPKYKWTSHWMNTAIQSGTGEFAGIGFVVPSNTIKRIVPVLIEKGEYTHPWLGISGITLSPKLAEKLNLPKNFRGALINGVVKMDLQIMQE